MSTAARIPLDVNTSPSASVCRLSSIPFAIGAASCSDSFYPFDIAVSFSSASTEAAWKLGSHKASSEGGCSGSSAAIDAGVRLVRPAGSVVLVGMGADELKLPLGVVQQRELRITGTFRYANTWPTAIALAASGRVSLDDLVTGEYGLAETEQALTAGHDPHSIKAVVRPALSDTHGAKGKKSELQAAG
ncbi:MAG: zinc-binding dehydrogenase [Chloroflexi bacterium]|nr:MAG: zinc-binding dehydrogenase [Chloroflexota bacterium]